MCCVKTEEKDSNLEILLGKQYWFLIHQCDIIIDLIISICKGKTRAKKATMLQRIMEVQTGCPPDRMPKEMSKLTVWKDFTNIDMDGDITYTGTHCESAGQVGEHCNTRKRQKIQKH